MKFIITLLSILLVLGVNNSKAQSDSVTIIGYFKVDNFYSVSKIPFYVSYRSKLTNLYSCYDTTQDFQADKDGCFEVRLPKSIIYSDAYFHFLKGNFEASYFDFPFENLIIQMKQRYYEGEIERSPWTGEIIYETLQTEEVIKSKITPNPIYDKEDIKRHGSLDKVLKDIH